MSDDDRRSRSTEAFWGRRRGKPLRVESRRALNAVLPEWKLDLTKPAPADLTDLFGKPCRTVHLEIGFGAGEHLASEAERQPDIGFIGVEPFVNSMARFLREGSERGLSNICVHDNDAVQVLDWLPDASVTRIDLLYPDPWPKKKHWKRRFVGPENLARFARVLAPGGHFRFASDIETYVNWTLAHVQASPSFRWTARQPADWHEPWPHWVRTRYEAKAIHEDRRPCYLIFERV